MTQAITKEEILACELINYIQAKPEHVNGLCFYFSGNHDWDDRYDWPRYPLVPDAYNMIATIRKRYLPQYGENSMVVNAGGPHSVRISFAKDMLKLVIKGKITFNTKQEKWEFH